MPDTSLDIADRHLRLVRDILAAHVPGDEVWAFGSRANGRAKPYSDLDLAVIREQPLPLRQSAALADAFEASDLPWRVDIVDWATTDAAFRDIITRDRVRVQAARTRGGAQSV